MKQEAMAGRSRGSLVGMTVALVIAAPCAAIATNDAEGREAVIAVHAGLDESAAPAATCLSCHTVPATTSHPIAVVPRTAIAAKYPLDTRGCVTCVTCHKMSAEGAGGPFFLRTSSGAAALCRDCHQDDPDRVRQVHALAIATAHFDDRHRRRVASAPLDLDSINCMGCHDGANAPSGDAVMAGSAGMGAAASGGIHPIGVEHAANGPSAARLVPAAVLNGSVGLYEGRIGCGSCHNPFSARRAHLVVDNAGSALCLQCHQE